jgi:hypothetical protein
LTTVAGITIGRLLRPPAKGQWLSGRDRQTASSICVGRWSKPTAPRRVDIIKNGMHIYTKEPRGKTFETVFRDFDVTPGKAYYYVRVLQRDPEAPDGDPEIAWSSPIFVRYR